MPDKWEIWNAKVKFEDDPNTVKERPVLVIDKSNCFLISLKITSHEPREQCYGEYQIIKWQEAGLSEESTIRCTKRLMLVETDFLNHRGTLQPIDISNIRALLSVIIY
ncbi:MAG: PemK family transcriptional regulator [Lachnospiraceae bacterium]|nr:PemK family transcriptional regulator [Candidatus Hippenecus merdae]